MLLCDKLAKLRKENHYTQEQLAEILEVSRQAVSKWESGVAYPETDKLIKLGELYHCSMDYLLKDDVEEKKSPVSFRIKDFYYEKKSEKTVRGRPLWHINIGLGRKAEGIIAIGFRAKGVISVGLFSMGLLSVGLFSLGLFSIGLLSLGFLSIGVFAAGAISAGSLSIGFLSFGAISVGIIAFGALSFGIFSVGATSIGEFSIGALAVGNYFALGDNARAMIAIGRTEAVGTIFQADSVTDANRTEIISLLEETVPKILSWGTELTKLFLKTG